MWQHHQRLQEEYESQIKHKMEKCNFDMNCTFCEVDFIEGEKNKPLKELLKEASELYMLFPVPDMGERYYVKLSITQQQYQKRLKGIRLHIAKEFLAYSLILIVISWFFAYYAIRPLKKALELNDEFVRDMLHDFNTPISSLKINFKILEKKFGQDSAILRSDQAMQRIANLQSNLSYFLSHSVLEKELVDIAEILTLRVQSHQVVFKDIDFQMDISSFKIEVNKDAFIRVIDNLLSNAGKYNKPKGSISIYMQEDSLIIEDTGIGIKEPQKIFERFYKETDRGIGIGLHIVKKLCNEMDINIAVKSSIGKGTKFFLILKNVQANH